MTERRQSDLAIYRRAVLEARPYWPHIGLYFLVGLLASPLALLTPWPLKIVTDSVLGGDPASSSAEALSPGVILLLAALMVIVVALLKELQSRTSSLLGTYASEKLVLGFRARILRHVQRLSFGYHDSVGTADSTYRMMWDASSLSSIAISGTIPLVISAITAISMLIIITVLDWQLGLIAIATTPLLLLSTHAYRRRLRPQYRKVKQVESSALAVVQEVLTSMRVVKAFGQEEREHARWVGQASQGVGARMRLALSEGGFGVLNKGIIAIGSAGVLFLGALHVQAGTITLGELLLIIGYVGMLYDPIYTITSKATGLQNSLTGAERAFAVLDEDPDVKESPTALPIARARGEIAFEDVSFSYRDGPPVLSSISFKVPAGSRVGVIGATGAGKTTLVSLLTRFADPSSGQIRLDGYDLRDLRLDDLRNQFSIVLQEPVLFSTTIAENISYAREEATPQEIAAAAELAGAREFIEQMPDGYETGVGERGMRLSGGERQRISLARAFLKDAPLLILDEPTSSVDVTTEAHIMAAVNRLMTGRTTFLIAHRLSTLRDCDMWVRLEGGRLVESTFVEPQDVADPGTVENRNLREVLHAS
jgi:ATP-binding cassette, subfamily B, bacterial